MSYIIGIDIGGTTIKGGIFSRDSRIIARTRVQSYVNANSCDEILERLTMAIDQLKIEALSRNLGNLMGIGIGVPGAVNRTTGMVYSSANLALKNINLKSWVEERLEVRCYVHGDAKVGAMAEKQYGAGQTAQSLLYVTLGTGVGAALILDGRLYEGDHLLAGEIGHIIVRPEGKPCGCGKSGCLETVVSGPMIAEAYQQRTGGPVDGSAELVARYATMGDSQACDVYREASRVLALVLANYSTVLDLSLIVIGGGLSLAGPVLFDPLREFYAHYTHPRAEYAAQIVPAVLGDESGLMGAQFLVQTVLNGQG